MAVTRHFTKVTNLVKIHHFPTKNRQFLKIEPKNYILSFCPQDWHMGRPSFWLKNQAGGQRGLAVARKVEKGEILSTKNEKAEIASEKL